MRKNCLLLLVFIFSLTDGLAQTIEVGQGTAISVFSPICRTRDYCIYEIVYLSSDIGLSGAISKLAFERVDGTDTALIDSVSIYMKHTSMTQLSNATFSTAGYTLVYEGTFPNDSGSGWREVILDAPFAYNGSDNLMVLTVKGYQTSIGNPPVCPRWYYTNISPATDRARRYYDDIQFDSTTMLLTTNFSSNVRLDFGTVGIAEIGGRKLQVYPNPTIDKITVAIPSVESTTILQIVDEEGRIVFSKSIDSNSGRMLETIDLGKLSGGIYFVAARNADGMMRAKIVVE